MKKNKNSIGTAMPTSAMQHNDDYDDDIADRHSDTVAYGDDLTDRCLDADVYGDDLADRHYDDDESYKDLTDQCFDADDGEYVLFPTGVLLGPFNNAVLSAKYYASIGNECRVVTLGEQFEGVDDDNKGVVFSGGFASLNADFVSDDKVEEYPDGGYAVGADGVVGGRYHSPVHYDVFKELGGHRCSDGSWRL